MRGPNTASAVSVNRMITPVTASLLRRNRRRNRRDLETRCRTVRSSAAAGVMVELVTVVTSQTLREPDPGVDHGDDDVGVQQARAGGDRGEESDSHGPVDVVAVDGLQEVGARTLDREDELDQDRAGDQRDEDEGDLERGRDE